MLLKNFGAYKHTIVCYNNSVKRSTWIFILRQDPFSIERFDFTYPTRSHYINNVALRLRRKIIQFRV